MCSNYYYALKYIIDKQDNVILRMREAALTSEKQTPDQLNELNSKYKSLFMKHAQQMKSKIPDKPEFEKIRKEILRIDVIEEIW